jgi:CheY-like chemotaxis protein
MLLPSKGDALEVIEAPPAWRPRSDADLLEAQLRALELWHRNIGSVEIEPSGLSREARLDEARRRDVAERERAALLDWAAKCQREDYPLGHGSVPRAVVAHRNEWLRDKLCSSLREAGVDVAGCVADGAEASAAVVLEQPDLVFLEDLLPTLTGLELVGRTRLFAPDALIGVHALGQSGMAPLLDAGARAAFSRRIPPAEIAQELVACLHGRHAQLTML